MRSCVTTVTDCGTSRSRVGVFVALVLSCASYPRDGLFDCSTTRTGRSTVADRCLAESSTAAVSRLACWAAIGAEDTAKAAAKAAAKESRRSGKEGIAIANSDENGSD